MRGQSCPGFRFAHPGYGSDPGYASARVHHIGAPLEGRQRLSREHDLDACVDLARDALRGRAAVEEPAVAPA